MLILILIFLIYYIWVFKNQLINVSSIHFKCHVSHTNKQTNKQRRIIATYKNEFHGTCIASKKQYKTQYVSTSKNSPKQLFPHIWLFSMSRKPFLTCTAFHPRKPQIIQELTSGLKSHKEILHKVKIQIRNKFNQNCYKYNLYKYFRLDSISSEFFSIWIIQTGSEF